MIFGFAVSAVECKGCSDRFGRCSRRGLNISTSTALFDFCAIVVICALPIFTHHFAMSLSAFEPVRTVVILSMFMTARLNPYALALTLPALSVAFGGHPSPIKGSLIAIELMLNVFVFRFLASRYGRESVALFASIIVSKSVYYAGKWLLIYCSFLPLPFLSGSIEHQVLYVLVCCACHALIKRVRSN